MPKGPLTKRLVLFVVVLIILASALTYGFFYFRCYSQRTRETTLKLDLFRMRQAIENYTLDKDQFPLSLQDLMNTHYLKEIPTDPFTRRIDWVLIANDAELSPNQPATGIVDVHSASKRIGCDGNAYDTW